eukprot:CAMPEP_0117589898 /NCGR_PEP_ID=MMETSP0784-20121206/70669_1 /TAXON_ID=39447 /ORGANISM="" /LENGTH=189 /DNA_ID=CAMNT_0005391433 /DNA_START=27 /DNA_END=594 /DNA_ORIENTATION=+
MQASSARLGARIGRACPAPVKQAAGSPARSPAACPSAPCPRPATSGADAGTRSVGAWTEVADPAGSGNTYWWNRATNETTRVGARCPSEPLTLRDRFDDFAGRAKNFKDAVAQDIHARQRRRIIVTAMAAATAAWAAVAMGEDVQAVEARVQILIIMPLPLMHLIRAVDDVQLEEAAASLGPAAGSRMP